MNAKIVGEDDEFFKISVRKFGEQYVACDGERVSIGVTEEDAVKGVEEAQESHRVFKEVEKQKKAAPIENPKGLGWFDGTSWGTK